MKRALLMAAMVFAPVCAFANEDAGVDAGADAGAAALVAPPDPDAPSVRILAKQGDKIVLAPKVKVGEPFHVIVTIAAKPGVVVNIPATFDTGPFEITERHETADAPSGPVAGERSFDLLFVGWEPGTHALPAIPVTYVKNGAVKQVTAGTLTVEISGVVNESAKADLRPLAGPVSVVQKDWRLVYAAAAALGGILLAVFTLLILRRVKKRKRIVKGAEPVVDLRSPDEIAREKLHTLAGSGLLDQVDRRPFYFTLTEIVREFLGRRFGFDAMELTTSELLETLGRAPGAEVARRDVEEWLLACDLVKFASLKVSREVGQAALDRATALVERLKPVMMPAATEVAPHA